MTTGETSLTAITTVDSHLVQTLFVPKRIFSVRFSTHQTLVVFQRSVNVILQLTSFLLTDEVGPK